MNTIDILYIFCQDLIWIFWKNEVSVAAHVSVLRQLKESLGDLSLYVHMLSFLVVSEAQTGLLVVFNNPLLL
jgi:hypothetical protein